MGLFDKNKDKKYFLRDKTVVLYDVSFSSHYVPVQS